MGAISWLMALSHRHFRAKRIGRHCPFDPIGRDGLGRLGKNLTQHAVHAAAGAAGVAGLHRLHDVLRLGYDGHAKVVGFAMAERMA